MTLLVYALSTLQSMAVHQKLEPLKLSILPCPPLSAIIAPLSGQLPTHTEALAQYSHTIEALRKIINIIPMRYGMVFANNAALCQALQPQREHYQTRLTEINQCVEFSIRVLIPAQPLVPQTVTGTAYLKLKQQHMNLHQHYTEEICELLKTCYLKHRVMIAEEQSLLSLYFLVPASRSTQFKEKIQLFQQQKILVSGPWAAYHFVN